MRFEIIRRRAAGNNAAAIRRISDGRVQWRVLAESWPDGAEWRGRLLFVPDDPTALAAPREGPPMLHGRSRAAVVSSAHELPERRLRQLLRSLA